MNDTTKGCTVKELREALAKLPDDLPVNVVKETTRGYNTYTEWVPLVLPIGGELYTDTFLNYTTGVELGNK